jgi:tRNA pseudouridine38-40 synthase
MAVRSVEAVIDTFHPRFDASSRRYRYRVFCQPIRDPLRERFAWRVQPAFQPGLLTQAAQQLTGTHDFSVFGSPTTPKGTTVRTVMKAEWKQVAEEEWQFDVQADAFLYRMVRRMVFVQVAAAQGKFPVEAIANALAGQISGRKRSEGLPSGLAPAHGLTLVQVTYGKRESVGQ